MTMTREQIKALQSIAAGIIQSAREYAPAGVIYAALQSQGCRLAQFESIMGTLVRQGFLTHDAEAHTYTATPAGLAWAANK
jgi:DNA-binding IclR family transcriptional regulator